MVCFCVDSKNNSKKIFKKKRDSKKIPICTSNGPRQYTVWTKLNALNFYINNKDVNIYFYFDTTDKLIRFEIRSVKIPIAIIETNTFF